MQGQGCELNRVQRGDKTPRSNLQLTFIRGIAGIAEASLDANVNRETGTSTAAARRSDFVWAIRVAKVSKGVLDGEWSHTTFAKGASFGLNEDKDEGEQLVEALAREGFEDVGKVSIDKDKGHVFLIQSDLGAPSGS